MEFTYQQQSKSIARHDMLSYAVRMLTSSRAEACCVNRTYVRDLYDYFSRLDESHEQQEMRKIDVAYITAWERLHDTCVDYKRPEDLTVCYLSGPEPENDFNEFISFGILPQNIWAFESDKAIYWKALESYNCSDYLQPKIVRTKADSFFENTPKKFDIVYIDACGTIISDQHALRTVASLFRNHRLSSPGMLITNFAEIDGGNTEEMETYCSLLSKYFTFKPDCNINIGGASSSPFSERYEALQNEIKESFNQYYGDFITSIISDIGSISIPALRFVNSPFIYELVDSLPENGSNLDLAEVNKIANNSLLKFFATNQLLKYNSKLDIDSIKIDKLANELSGGESWSTGLLKALYILHEIKHMEKNVKAPVLSAASYFETSNQIYRFLDMPSKELFYDLSINQFAYPMHYSTSSTKRCTYIAKSKRMYMDVIPFDECRYVYEWLPSLHQIENAYKNVSWQCVFRFAVDGLVKQRLLYNNEFFFQGSVVSSLNDLFSAKKRPVRTEIL